MTILNGYCTLPELKTRFGILPTDTADDTTLEAIVEAVSREIDSETKTRFWTTAADEVRYYQSIDGETLYTDDIISVTEIAVDTSGNRTYASILAASDYDLLPDNAALDGKPYTWLAATPNGRRGFSTFRRGNRITGKFGYSAVTPKPVHEACLLQCERIFMRKDSPLGVVGTPDVGYVRVKSELDPDVQKLLDSVRRPTV